MCCISSTDAGEKCTRVPGLSNSREMCCSTAGTGWKRSPSGDQTGSVREMGSRTLVRKETRQQSWRRTRTRQEHTPRAEQTVQEACAERRREGGGVLSAGDRPTARVRYLYPAPRVRAHICLRKHRTPRPSSDSSVRVHTHPRAEGGRASRANQRTTRLGSGVRARTVREEIVFRPAVGTWAVLSERSAGTRRSHENIGGGIAAEEGGRCEMRGMEEHVVSGVRFRSSGDSGVFPSPAVVDALSGRYMSE